MLLHDEMNVLSKSRLLSAKHHCIVLTFLRAPTPSKPEIICALPARVSDNTLSHWLVSGGRSNFDSDCVEKEEDGVTVMYVCTASLWVCVEACRWNI
jgi:hypothetical protein